MPLKELDATPDLRDDPAIKDFNTLPDLVKSYKETKSFVGMSIRPPGPDASPEARKEFLDKLVKHAPELVPLREGDADAEKVVWSKLGRPEKPEDYKANVPENAGIDVAALRTVAATAGLTQKQFDKLVEKTLAGAEQAKASVAQDRAALRAEWGAAYEQKLKNAAATAQKLGLDEAAVGAIMAGNLKSSQLKVWDAIATAVPGEGRGNFNGPGRQDLQLTPAEAEARFKEVQNHPAYFNKNHPEHDVYVAKGAELMKVLHPD